MGRVGAAVRRVALGLRGEEKPDLQRRCALGAHRLRREVGGQVGDSALRVAERAFVRLALSGMGVAEAGVRVRRLPRRRRQVRRAPLGKTEYSMRTTRIPRTSNESLLSGPANDR